MPIPSMSGVHVAGISDSSPPKKNFVADLKLTILSVRYIVIGFIPITTKTNAHFLYSKTSIIGSLCLERMMKKKWMAKMINWRR